jgi:hypothetical protein
MKQLKCQNYSQVREKEPFPLWILLHVITVTYLVFLISAHAAEKIEVTISRAPASAVIDTDIIEHAEKYPHWLNRLTKEDSKGVMVHMRNQIDQWERQDQYIERWNVSSHVMQAEDLENRRRFVKRQALKYLDKRLTGELKRADSHSGLYKVAQAKKNLSPSSQINVGENMKLKFRAKVLQGKATILFKNDYFESEAVLKASGRANVRVHKELSEMGVRTEVDLDAQAGRWRAILDKQIDENWSTRVVSDQDDKDMVFSKDADTRVELYFSKPF